jgi:sodium transport system permease protein
MIFTICKKELKDTLRDRRTLIMMLVIPLLIFPVILNVFVGISKSFSDEAATKKVKIGLVETASTTFKNGLKNSPKSLGEKEILIFKDSTALRNAVQSDSIDFGVFIPSNFETLDKKNGQSSVTIYYNGTEMGTQERAVAYLKTIDDTLKKERYKRLKIEEKSTTPLLFNYSNVASNQEMIGKLAGGILPYIFIAFGFIGCMYPAIDLFTGEKERGTIETIITTPIPRWKILFGKMGVVVLSGLLAATFSLLGLFLSIELLQEVENKEILAIVHSILSPGFIATLFIVLIPLTIFFAGVMIPIAVYAKSFKEAQSIITPLNLVVILPAMAGFFPGIEYDFTTACIPVVNIVLATKELIAGTLDYSLLFVSFMVMSLLAAAAVFLSYKRFDKETNVVM